MKKLITLLLVATTVFLAKAQTQTYLIQASDLVSMTSNCGTNGAFYISGGGTTGFNWTDNIPSGSNITSITAELGVGIECGPGTRTTALNSVAQPSFTTVDDCVCNPTGTNGIKTISLSPSNYTIGGVNQFRMTASSSFGLMPKATFSNAYARITVNYTTTVSTNTYCIPLAQLVNMGSNCGSTGAYYVNGGGITGFDWTDNIPTGNTITSVVAELAVGIECGAGTRTTTLNSVAQPSFTTATDCNCDPNVATNGITTLNLNPSNYIKSGTNQFRINASNHFGLMPKAAIANCYARIIVTHSSASNFVVVTAPNGGENLSGATTQNITWATTGSVPNVNLEYSTNGGTNWITIVNNISNTGSYAWSVPNINSTTTRVRVVDASNTSNFDASNSNFTITQSSFTITAPNGGEIWGIGSSRNITWTSTGSFTTVNLFYSTNGGTNWISIANNVSNSGTYAWTVANNASTTSRVRVESSVNTSIFDVSDANFTINNSTIDVYCIPLAQLVNFPTTCSNGQYYAQNAGTSGFDWTDNTPTGNTVTSIVAELSMGIECNSSGSTITTALNSATQPTFNMANECVCAPSGANGIKTLNLTTTDLIKGGTNQFRMNFTYYLGMYPRSAIDNCYARITVTHVPSGAQSLTVSSPNGGESWTGNTTQNITWVTTGSIPNVNLEYSTNSGANWITIVNNIANTNTYAWTVPNINTTNARVRVVNTANTSISDVTNADFTISQVQSLTVTAPNGGQNFNGGSTQNITWTTSGTITNVNLQYSTDGGAGWTNIVNGIANSGTYAWTVPCVGSTSTNCRVRVLNSSNTSINDISDANFTITNNSALTITAPNGGQNWTTGSAQNITWNTSGATACLQYVDLQYSTNGGTNWTTITTGINNTGTYSWTVPTITTSTTCRVRVQDYYNPSTIFDISDANFTITNSSSLTLTAPNGGQTIAGGTTYNITWNYTGSFQYVKFEYSTNGGTNWTNCANASSQNWANTADQTYPWVVPAVSSTNCLIRISEYYTSTPSDVSDAVFTINYVTPTLTLTAPNGGQNYNGGSTQNITWSNTGTITNVNLQYSTDGGSNWTNIVTGISNSGTYAWTVPCLISSTCRVRVLNTANTSINDISDANFSINYNSTITVSSPNGGENWTTYTTENITWSTTGSCVQFVNIYYSTNSGTNWNTIVTNTANDGTHAWSIPALSTSTTCRIRIEDYTYGSTIFDISNANFTITASTNIVETYCIPLAQLVNFPTTCSNGQYYAQNAGTSGFNWTDNTPTGNTVTSVVAELSMGIECNSSGSTITTSLNSATQPSFNMANECVCAPSGANGIKTVSLSPSDLIKGGTNQFRMDFTYYLGMYPRSAIDNCYARITVTHTPSGADALTISSPNGGETWNSSTTQNITWVTTGSIPNVNLQYSTDGGSNWISIVNNITNSGTYAWSVPAVSSSTCRVRVQNTANTSVFDVSNANFTIAQVATLTLTSPNGGQNYASGSTYSITWTNTGTVSNVNLQYSTNGGSNWNTIVNGITNNNTYAWTVPCVATSTTCRVRVLNSANTSVNDISDANFTITNNAALAITTPNGGENWLVGTNYTILWNTTGGCVDYVNLQYSTDGGTNWTSITSGITNNGTYNWTVPTINTSTTCRIRVQDYYNPSTIFDISNANFTITNNSTVTLITPNGGEVLTSGNTYNITWSYTGSYQYVKFEYSTNGGANWSNCANASSQNWANTADQTYAWVVPSVSSNNCLVRVSEYYTSIPSDISNAIFTINNNQSFTLTSPNGGENWSTGTNYNITWTYTGTMQYVNLQYSTNAGSSWNNIVTGAANSGSYAWTVPNIATSTICLVRVQNYNNTSIFDISNAVFTITNNPTLTVTTPNGGETWTTGAGYYIYWTSTGISNLKLEYSTNAGGNWNTITNSTNASTGYYYWTVPNTPTTQARVRATDVNSSTTDMSNANFTIISPTLTVIYPNGGEVWTGLTSQTITWSGTNTSNYARVELTTNMGTSWSTLSSAVYYVNNGSLNITVPNANSNQCKVRVTDYYNSTVTDESNAVFTIQQATPAITVTYPNGGETFAVGSGQYITWNSVSVANVNIEYSTNNGTDWLTVVNSTNASTGYYYWTVPATTSTTCLVRVSEATSGNPVDQSNAVFSIVQPVITVVTPNGGETLTGLSNYSITWTSDNISSYVRIRYSTNNGTNWTYVTTAAYNNGSYTWTVPNIASTNCKIRIEDYYTSSILDESDAVFTINQAPAALTLTTPNGGETWVTSNGYYIYWTATSISNVKLEYTTDGGTDWITITNSASGSLGYYYWTVPNTPSNNCYVRVSDASNSSTSDVSNDNFSIVQPTITVTSPNGGETWVGLTNYNITWNSTNASNYVNLAYSSNNGSSWNTITGAAYNSGTYTWNTPNITTSNALVRVQDYYNTSINDQSNAVFTINQAAASITVNSPNTNVSWAVGTNYYITWTAVSISNVKIEYSTDGGTDWTEIASSVSATSGSYLWTVPNTPSTQCRVRVSDASNSSVSDISNQNFTIVAPEIIVTNPNGGEIYDAFETINITWNSNLSNYVKIFYSTNNGTTWNTITNSTYNNGTYSWYVPNTPSNACLVRVQDYYSSTVVDQSNAVFEILAPSASVTLTTPNGGNVWAVNSSYDIRWNSVSISAVKLSYSTNNGTDWTVIVNTTTASTGKYTWSVPNTPSINCLVKVENADTGANGLPFDVSDAVFTITTPFITVTSPNGGQTWTVGDNKYITWTSAGVGNVKIELSTNNGTSYTTVVNSVANQGYYYWTVPNSPSLQCKVKVSDVNNASVTDASDLLFAIVAPAPTITVTSPNGGNQWIVGSSYYITWSSTAVNTVKIEYTSNSGLTWNVLANNFSNNGYYYWTVPNAVSNDCWVRVSSATNASVTDMSDAKFSIVPNTPSITVTSPNSNTEWCEGSYRYITWSATAVSSVNIEITTNGGTNWTTLASSINNVGYAYLMMPNTTSANVYIRISDANSSLSTTSAQFSLITCTASNNSIITDSVDVEICKGDSVKVSFSKVGIFSATNTFLVQLSDSVGNFNNATVIGTLQSADADTIMAYVPVSVKSSNGYRVRVISDNPVVYGTDNGDDISILGNDFTFSANSILKYLPDGSVEFTFEGDTANVVSYAWSFGDGDSSTVRNPTHIYSSVGYFDVSLTVTNTNGCAVTVYEPFYIRVERVLTNTTLITNTTSNVNAVAFATNTTGCIALNDGNCLVTTDGGTTWVESTTGAGGPLRGASLVAGNWVVSGADGFLAKSTDQGATWSNYNVPSTATINSVVMQSATKGFAVDADGNLLSYDGTSWTSYNVGSLSMNSISAKGNYAYAAGENGSIYRYSNSTWTALTTNSTANYKSIQFVDSAKGYAVAESGLVMRTTDKGDTWETVLSGLDIDFTTIMATGRDSAIAAGKEGILYFTKDGGNMWERYSIGELTDLEGSAFRGGKGYVSGNAGTLRMIGTDAESSTGVDNQIFNNSTTNNLTIGLYPNPTLGNVNLVIETVANTSLSVNLKDMQGRTLIEVVNDKTTGVYSNNVDMSELPAGVYFFHIRNEDRSIVKRIVKQ